MKMKIKIVNINNIIIRSFQILRPSNIVIYNTETGDVYRAYNGFTDSYHGEKYKTVIDDMYTSSISGYIEKQLLNCKYFLQFFHL